MLDRYFPDGGGRLLGSFPTMRRILKRLGRNGTIGGGFFGYASVAFRVCRLAGGLVAQDIM